MIDRLLGGSQAHPAFLLIVLRVRVKGLRFGVEGLGFRFRDYETLDFQ